MSEVTSAPAISIPPDVQAFSQSQRVETILPAVVELTQRLFPDGTLTVTLDDDPEIANDRSITLLVRGLRMTAEEASETAERWDRGLLAVCPPPLASVFRLGLGLRR
jgi:hypothetical protein